MNVRSRGLAALGLALLAGSAIFGAILAHDGDSVRAASLAEALPGQHVEVKGTPETFYPRAPLREWREIVPLLGNWTYALESDAVLVVLTGELAAPNGQAVAEGLVIWTGDHPEQDGRVLVIVEVTGWREPLLR